MSNQRLFWILALAFLLRIVGIQYGLPQIYHQDEPVIVNHALAIGARGWNPHFFIIPPFTIYGLFIVYVALYLAGHLIGFFHSTTDFAALFVSDPSLFYVSGRVVLGALFGTATVALTAALSKRYFSAFTAFWASLFLSLCLLHSQHSHYIYADIPVTFFILLLFYLLMSANKKSNWRVYAGAGACFGAAVATKYTAVYFLPAILIYFVVIHGKQTLFLKNLAHILLATVTAFFVYLLIAPYTFLDWPSFYLQMSHQAGSEWPMGPWYHLVYSLANGGSILLLILAAAGAILIFLERSKPGFLLLIAAGTYYTVNIFFTQPFARYMMPLIPVTCILGALGAQQVGPFLKNKPSQVIFISIVLISLACPSIYSDILLLRPDTRDLCQKWIEANAAQGTAIVLDNRFYGPHLKETPEQIRLKKKWLEAPDAAKETRLDLLAKASEKGKTYVLYTLMLQPEQEKSSFLFEKPFIKMDWDSIRETGIRYLVVNYSQFEPEYEKFRQAHQDHLKLAASFSPYFRAEQKQMLDKYSSTAAPDSQKELFSRKNLGPYLEIYEVIP